MFNQKIVFLGTPEFAACILQGLLDAHYNVIAVITQPDKEIGRKKVLTPTPVKEVALRYHLPIYQPISLKREHQFLIDLKPDMLITAAYGQILPQVVLDIATINNINVHASLLPKLRGGAPIHRAIINGEAKTGVTIMQMVQKMDAGKMYAKEEFPLDDSINTTQLFQSLQEIGKNLLLKVLPDLLTENCIGEEQDESQVTYAYNIRREEEKIDFSQSRLQINRLIRGLAMTPGAYAYLNGKTLKIFASKIVDLPFDHLLPGTLRIENKKHLYVKCLDGYLELLVVQMEGKKMMRVQDFLNGIKIEEVSFLQ